MTAYKQFVQRIGLLGITNILFSISSLILIPIMTKSFSTSNYGIWVLITTTVGLIPNLATLGLLFSMGRFLSAEKDKEKIKEGFYSITAIILISSLALMILIILFSKDIASAILNNDINLTILLSVIIFMACLNSSLLYYFRTFRQIKRYSIFYLLQTYLGLIFVSYFALNRFSLYITTSGLLIAYLIIFVIMIFFIISDIGFTIPKFKNIREYLSFGIPIIPSNLSYWIVDSSDRYVIGVILGTTFVGYYSPGYMLGSIILLMGTPFSLLLPAVLPKYHEVNDTINIRLHLKYSIKYFLLLAIPSAFGLSILSKPILMILTTPVIASNGYIITPYIAFSFILVGIYGIISNVIILEKKTKIIGMIWMIGAAINLILNILLIPYFGIIIAGINTLITFVTAFVLTIMYSNKFFKLDFDLIFIIKCILASILMSVVIILINPSRILNILMTIIISSGLYFALLLFFKSITKEEIKFFKDLLQND